ncbi:hypothetical protein CJ468_02079 [Nocardia farcinica]|nr:hypothetical protein CJ468_02079 [Nocardia farcinica]SLH98031.1 Uncharacterised protein [Mycobacteroides abscessus subsp. abscessus]
MSFLCVGAAPVGRHLSRKGCGAGATLRRAGEFAVSQRSRLRGSRSQTWPFSLTVAALRRPVRENNTRVIEQ